MPFFGQIPSCDSLPVISGRVSTEVEVKAISPEKVKQEIINVSFMLSERKRRMLLKEVAFN